MRHDRGREARAWGARGALTADLDRANVRQVARIDAGGRLPALAPAHVRADGDVHHRPRLAGRVAGAPDDVAVQEAAVDDVQRELGFPLPRQSSGPGKDLVAVGQCREDGGSGSIGVGRV